MDVNVFTTETRQLVFNFSAIQLYEILLAATATLLVARRIWYDSSLLVVLENMLWIVPFILVSQAAFIEQRVAVFLCLVAVTLVAGRMTRWDPRQRNFASTARLALWSANPARERRMADPLSPLSRNQDGVNITSGAALRFQ